MNGYLEDPEATAACTTDDGFVTCGDIVVVDDEGFIRIVDRKKDLIISGGVNVYPRDVEESLATHPSVAEAAVVGVPDERLGRAGRRLRRAAARATLDDDLRGARRALPRPLLAGYKVPATYASSTRCRATPAGKILKRELRDRHDAEHEGRDRSCDLTSN